MRNYLLYALYLLFLPFIYILGGAIVIGACAWEGVKEFWDGVSNAKYYMPIKYKTWRREFR